MEIASVQLVYFSPTGTTKRVLEGIAEGMGRVPVRSVDITQPQNRERPWVAAGGEVLVVGVPVYFGRVQAHAAEWLKTIQGHDTPAVCVVVYGNREYDDALLELKEILASRGCVPIACAAYIGEHSFSTPQTPLAVGRPDSSDLSNARAFGGKIMEKLRSVSSIGQVGDIAVPGKHPYIDMKEHREKFSGLDLVSVDGACVQCGECARRCPVGAVDTDCSSAVDTSKCILCHACVEHCPINARQVKNEWVRNVAARLSGAFQVRKEPVTFL
jgi:ferredoxin